MKVKFNRAALHDGLGLVTGVVPSRTPKPILRCLRMTCQDDGVKLSATDLEVGVSCVVGQVEIEKAGDIVVPADEIAAIVRESSDEVLELEASEATVRLQGADSHFTIYSQEPSQYPAIASFEGDSQIEASLGDLQEGIELTIFAAAKESTRYALNGVLWEVAGKKLTLVATDGRRLAKSIVNLTAVRKDDLPEGRIIVPAKTMNLLDKITVSPDAKVSVKFVGNQVVLGCEQVVISSNLVEGNFPKYEDIIPTDYENKVTLNREAALSAVRRAALLADEDSKGIKLSLAKNSIIFTSRAPETGDAEVDMAVAYSGTAMEIGFNPQFLVDVLRTVKADEVGLELGDPDRPGLIRSGNFLYIVMPVNL